MSLDINLKKLIKNDPSLGNFIIEQAINWPTTPKNIKTNCSLFNSLNPDGLIVSGLDENSDYYKLCRDYAYISLALKQRGIMNMTYYLILDKIFSSHDSNSENGMAGGMKIRDFILGATAFSLLGKPEGVQPTNQVIVTPAADSNSLLMPTQLPIGNIEELQPYRQKEAQQRFDQLMTASPWIFPQTEITIADNLNQEQYSYYKRNINELNSNLESISTDAEQHCINIASLSGHQGLFSNEELYKQIEETHDSMQSEITIKRTSHTIQDNLAYLSKGISSSYSSGIQGIQGISSPQRTINDKEITDKAVQTVANNINKGLVSHMEQISYEMQYSMLCRLGMPKPKFVLSTSSDNGVYSIKLNTRFGNEATSSLLLAQFDLMGRIDLKMKSIDGSSDDYKRLQSLKERLQIQKGLIESSTLFVPLDFAGDIEGFADIISQGKKASEKFNRLVEQLGEYLPITEQDWEYTKELNKKIRSMTSERRQQVIDEWIALIDMSQKTGTTVLSNTLQNVVEVSVDAIQKLETVTTEGVGAAGYVTKKVVEKVGETGNEGVKQLINMYWEFLPVIISILGIFAASGFGLILFRTYLIRGLPTTQQGHPYQQQGYYMPPPGYYMPPGQPYPQPVQPASAVQPAEKETGKITEGGRYTRKNKNKKNKNKKNKSRKYKNKTHKRRRKTITKTRKFYNKKLK